MFQNTYNEILSTTTIIRFPNKPSEHGSGFFYNYNGDTFLITNRHVIEHSQEQPDSVDIWFRDYNDIENAHRVSVDLYEDGFPRWLIHPGFPNADVTAIPLNQRLSHINDDNYKTGSLALSSDVFAEPDLLIRSGTGARVFGYPSGYIDKESLFPVARSGMIASPYGGWFNDRPEFLVDGRMGPGMSGSPVFTERTGHFEKVGQGAHVAAPSTFLIGIHAGDYRSPDNQTESNLNLNHVWYAEIIESLLAINGLCDYVDSVEYSSPEDGDELLLDPDLISELVSQGTWDLFDPEYES